MYNTDRCKAFQCDITCDDLTNEIPANSVDAVSMIFVLSAIHPDKMVLALKNIYKVNTLRETITERKHKIVPISLFRWVQMINDRERPFY